MMSQQADHVLAAFAILYTNHIHTFEATDDELLIVAVWDEHGEQLRFIMTIGSDDDGYDFILEGTDIHVRFDFEPNSGAE